MVDQWLMNDKMYGFMRVVVVLIILVSCEESWGIMFESSGGARGVWAEEGGVMVVEPRVYEIWSRLVVMVIEVAEYSVYKDLNGYISYVRFALLSKMRSEFIIRTCSLQFLKFLLIFLYVIIDCVKLMIPTCLNLSYSSFC